MISAADPPWQAAIYQTSITEIAIKREFQQMGKLTGLKYILTEIVKWLPLKYKEVPQFKSIKRHVY